MNETTFPLSGCIGIIANGADEIDLALSEGLRCVEIRADLLIDSGLDESAVLDIVRAAQKKGLNTLLTLRRLDHGGRFSGEEQARVDFYLRAMEAGCNIVDVEWDSESGEALIRQGVPTILSYHNFESTPDDEVLEKLTRDMLAKNPTAIKVVPTAQSFDDGLRMLHWVADAGDGPARIGFAMGELGGFTRLLTINFGGAITYGSFGDACAPGQFSINDMKSLYRVESIQDDTVIVGLIANSEAGREWAASIVKMSTLQEGGVVTLPLVLEDLGGMKNIATELGIRLFLLDGETGRAMFKRKDPKSVEAECFGINIDLEGQLYVSPKKRFGKARGWIRNSTVWLYEEQFGDDTEEDEEG